MVDHGCPCMRLPGKLSKMRRTLRMRLPASRHWMLAHPRLLALNIGRAWRWHLLGFRLMAFGLYEPHPWYGGRAHTHRWWQVNPRVAWLLFRHTAAYGRWLAEMKAATRTGRPGWWEQQAGPAGCERLRAWLDAEN